MKVIAQKRVTTGAEELVMAIRDLLEAAKDPDLVLLQPNSVTVALVEHELSDGSMVQNLEIYTD